MRLALAVSLLLVLAGSAGADEPSVYIFDVLNRPTYGAAYRQMLQGKRGLPAWMGTVAAARRSTATPGKIVQVDSRRAELFQFCKPHDCAGNEVSVLFVENGEAAKARLISNGVTTFFGSPSPQERVALSVEF